MIRRILLLSVSLSVLIVSSCTSEKMINEMSDTIKKLDARLAAIEKMVLAPEEAPPQQKTAIEIPLEDSYVLGDKNAKIHVVVFSNFQCPACAQGDKAFRELLKDDELKSTINVVFKHFPFERHKEARPASKVALAAGEQGKFWEMAEKIFANQGSMNHDNYLKWAKELGLNMAKFEKDLKDNDAKYNQIIDRDIKFGSEKAYLEGTPWVVVGGWILEDRINAASIKKLIKEKNL